MNKTEKNEIEKKKVEVKKAEVTGNHRVIVFDSIGSGHSYAVAQAIRFGYGLDKDIEDRIIVMDNWNEIKEACINGNIEAIVRSYSGLNETIIKLAESVYPKTLWFQPLHNNTWALVNKFPTTEPPVVCVTGAGDNENRNNTSFGNGMEFWDRDWDWYAPGQDAASYANGFVCGELLRLKDDLNIKYDTNDISWWQARYIMRMTCYRTEPNRINTPWDLRNGFGSPSKNWALYRSEEFINEAGADPYNLPMLEPGEIQARLMGVIDIVMPEIRGAVTYKLYCNGKVVHESDKRVLSYVLKEEGIYRLQYTGVDASGNESNKSKVKEIIYKLQQVTKKQPIIKNQ